MTWRAFIDDVTSRVDPEFRKAPEYGPPAPPKAIERLERQLGCSLPAELRELLLEHDGVRDGDWLVWSIKEMAKNNLEGWREPDLILPTDLLAFASAGADGILFAFEKGSPSSTIFAWDPIPHERPVLARSLRAFIEGWKLGTITV